jgi:hypothetical protein
MSDSRFYGSRLIVPRQLTGGTPVPRLVAALFFLAALAAGAEETPPKQDFYLIIDYLPLAVYEGDAISACFRVENTTSAAADVEVVASITDEAGKEIWRKAEKLSAPSKGFSQCQFNLDSAAGTAVSFTLSANAQVRLRLVRDENRWPDAQIKDGRLATEDKGELILPVVRKRLRTPDRAFAPLKWMVDSGSPLIGKGEAGRAFIPGRWALTAETKDPAKWAKLGPYAADGATPMACALRDILKNIAQARTESSPEAPKVVERAVIFLPPEDLDVATDPRMYRILLDALLVHLKKADTRQIVLVPPLLYGASEKHRQSLWRAVHEAALANEVRSVDPTEYLNEKNWRADPAREGAYANRPNPEGMKKIEQALTNLLP